MNRRIASVFAAGFCTFVNLYAPQSLLPTLADAFDASAAKAGLTITASLVAVALVAPFAGGISDVFGRRRLIVPASLIVALPTFLAGLSSSLDVLVLLRFLQGLLLPFIFTITVAYIADECPGAEGVRATGTYSWARSWAASAGVSSRVGRRISSAGGPASSCSGSSPSRSRCSSR